MKRSIRQVNYDKIIKAAVSSFAQKGFKGTTVQGIAETAELPKANVLYYFKSKNGIYDAVLADILSIWNSSFDNADENDDPAMVLSQYILEKLELSRTHPEASKIFAMEMINGAQLLSDEVKQDMLAWFKSRTALIQTWIDAGKMKAVDPELLMYHIWATTQHYADFSTQISILREGDSLQSDDFEHIGQYLCSAILGSCGLSSAE